MFVFTSDNFREIWVHHEQTIEVVGSVVLEFRPSKPNNRPMQNTTFRFRPQFDSVHVGTELRFDCCIFATRIGRRR